MPTHTPEPALFILQYGAPSYEEQTELLADDSASSADATTALPTGSSVNDGGDSAAPLCHERNGSEAAAPGASKPPWETATLQAP